MKSLKLYLGITAFIIVIYLVAQFNRPKAVDWSATFSSSDKIPFGTYVIYNRLNDIFPKAKVETFREPLYNVINDHGITHGTYLIISNSVNLNEYDCQKLLNFIKSGNDVFITASNFGDELSKQLKIETNIAIRGFGATSGIKFTDKYLDTGKIYHFGKNIGDWYFSKFDTAKMTVLGLNTDNHPDFLKYTAGKGSLYLNANPFIFTNYSLFTNNGNDYASIALSYVKNDSNLIWDQYYSLGREDEGSSMRVFLRSDALRWAFYITFFSLVLFVLYEMKRRQRIIPVVDPLENSTLAFVNVVGQVYFEQHDNRNISTKKILYFLEHIRIEFNLKTNQLDEEFINNLSQKTGIDLEFATKLVNYITLLNDREYVNNKELIELNNLIEKFYTKSR
ncbi:MAG TPA: DUF4350 domain-containing protein [Mucilaginibacter sp.]|jgi:hypothetical protein|nr:DUF4350 domain-containing protein [Mucilaginibacter sp.]